jgi:hypothetical protein
MAENKRAISLLLTPRLKEIAQKSRGFAGSDPAIDFGGVMAGRLRKKAGAMIHRPAFGIFRRIIEPADAGERYGPRTHAARFERDIEIAADQPFAAQNPRTGS